MPVEDVVAQDERHAFFSNKIATNQESLGNSARRGLFRVCEGKAKLRAISE